MPLLIGLLIFFGCFAVGRFLGGATVTVITLVFTAPGFLFEKFFDKNATKTAMFLVDLVVWTVTFTILYFCGKLTLGNVIGFIVLAFLIGGIVWFGWVVFWEGGGREVVNCPRCGKPYSYEIGFLKMFCRTCQREYDNLLDIEIRKQPTTIKCYACAGTGRNKTYKCVTCRGRGALPREQDDITSSAGWALLAHNPEWNEFFRR